MPGQMDGLALAKLAHARFPQLKLIISSSRLPEEGVSALADAFLVKPYDLAEVVERVENLLAQNGND
jgi:DNA-binding response OmpR family regulator